jgi:type I restriction enzyme S subunit
MSAAVVELGDVATFVRGITFGPDDVVPVGTTGSAACMRTKNVQAELDLTDVWGIPESFVKRGDQYLIPGDMLVSSANSWNLVGKSCWVPDLPWRSTFGGFISVLRPNPTKVDPRYLFRWFTSDRTQATVRSFGQQTTNISNLNVGRCLNLILPLPPLPEQRRIAEILDKADALRAKRRAALAQLDSLTQSIFLDMFGDPGTNPKGWPIFTLREMGIVKTGGTPASAKTGMFDGPIPFVTPGDLESDDLVKRSVTEAGAAESRTVRSGATLVCCIGATIGKIGRAAVRSAFNQQINAVEWGESVHDTYGFAVLRFFKPTIIAWGASTTLPILKKSAFERIEIPVPPIELQTEFAARSAEVERLEQYFRTFLAHCNDLFASLQTRAFRGEL